MIIKNARVFNEDGIFEEKDIFIQNGFIIEPDSEKNLDGLVIDGSGLLAVPGLVDIHFHGAFGQDFCDANIDGLEYMLESEVSKGVMAVCPATMTLPEEKLNAVIDTALMYRGSGASLMGINMEGPFISRQKVAAQNPEYVMEADGEMFERLLSRSKGLIKIVDIAPEVGNNMEFIDRFASKVSVSLAHTMADYDTAKAAFKRGAVQLTHMFNAMNDIGHRSPGPVLAAYEEGAYVELICDGIHNHDAVIRMVFDLFDKDKVVLISDSMRAAGLEDGEYTLGGQKVTVRGNKCFLSDNPGVIAGSNTCLFDCLKYAVKTAGVSLEKALRAATINPARAIGIDNAFGSLAVGHVGNVILMDDSFNIKYLFKNGKLWT